MFRRIGLYLTPQTLHLRNPRIAYALARDPISPRSPPSWTPSSPLGGIARGKSSRQPARVARTRGPPETRNAARDGIETRPAREGAISTRTPGTSGRRIVLEYGKDHILLTGHPLPGRDDAGDTVFRTRRSNSCVPALRASERAALPCIRSNPSNTARA